MLDNAINSIRKERAALAREIEYMRESMEDDKLDEIMESVEGSDSKAELIEAAAYANSVDVTEEETRDIVVRWGVRDMPCFMVRTAEHHVHAII